MFKISGFSLFQVINKLLPDKIYSGLTGTDLFKMVSSRIAGRKNSKFKYLPKISIVVPVYNIETGLLKKCIDSVLKQIYENWELCVVDDASKDKKIAEVLSDYQKADKRIKVEINKKNVGISSASNDALSLATGEFIAFLDHDDELHKNSLVEVVRLLNIDPDADLIFTDEDKLTMEGKRLRPEIKTGWSKELFLTYNYLCHLVVCRKILIDEVGGFRTGFEGSQDYDLLLRITELTEKIQHIPKVLYHWRMIPGSAAEVVDAKEYAFERSKQALRDAMGRRGIDAIVSDSEEAGKFEIKYRSKQDI